MKAMTPTIAVVVLIQDATLVNRYARIPMRAIVIEDDIDIQQQIVERLKSEGFAVDSANNGDEGL